MRLEDYIRVIRKRWWIVVLVAMSASVAAFVISKLQTPLYRSRAEYSVGINRLDSGASLIGADRILNNYRNLIYNPDEMQFIAQSLKIDRTGSQLMRDVTVQPQPNESRFVIEVDYPDPETSVRLAAAVGERLNAIVVEQNRNLTGEDRLSLTRTLTARFVELSQPKTRINVLAGGILGLILGVLLAFVLEYLDDTLKTAADVERYSKLPTIGSIPSDAAQGGRGRPRLRVAPSSGIVASPAQHNRKHHDD